MVHKRKNEMGVNEQKMQDGVKENLGKWQARLCVCVFGTTVQLMVVSVCMCCNAEYFLPVLTDQMY